MGKVFGMKQGSFKYIVLLVFALSVLAFAGSTTSDSLATAVPDHLTLTWTGDPSTTMTVTWRTDIAVTRGVVQYQEGTGLTSAALKANADPREFVTDLGPTRLFSATLVRLSPNKRYSYRVGDGEHWSGVRSFQTADSGGHAFKFLVFGDSQSNLSGDPPYALWRDTVQNAFKANPDAKFMVNMGDLVDFGQRGAHWNAWFAAAAGVIDAIPVMPILGNHEFFGSDDSTRPEYFLKQFALPQNGPEGLKSQAYSYDYGSVHFVVLDSQKREQEKRGDILKMQLAWLDADLAASRADWKIVFFHRPPYGIMARRPNEDVKAAFCPIIEKHRVNLVFNAHDHGIARTYPIRDGVYLKDPSQGTVYYVSGRSGRKTYPNLEKMPWSAFFYDPQDQPNYFVINVTDKKLTVVTIKQDGTVLDVYSIEKAGDADSVAPQVLKPAASVQPSCGIFPQIRIALSGTRMSSKSWRRVF